MDLISLFGYIALSVFFFMVFETYYPFMKYRIIFILSACWPVTLIVIAADELIQYVSSSSED
ncbi:MAG: hypothetical protein EBV23_03715 [Flavobacteriia bacterium]|nr:hypothetical protein [Flavobacteriia bacterium]